MIERTFAATFALLLLVGAAQAQDQWKQGRFGDKLTGDIHRIDESDIFVDEIVTGSRMKVQLTPAMKSNYRPLIGIYAPGEDFESLPVLVKVDPDKPPKPGKPVLRLKTLWTPLATTGKYRIRVLAQSADDLTFSGDYSLKVKIQVNKQFGGTVPIPEGGEGTAEFSAHAGSRLNLVIKAGPGTDLPTLTDILDPDGESLLAGADVKVTKKSILVKKLDLAMFGVYRVKVDGEAFKSFTFKAKIKPPKRKWEKVDVRDIAPPPLPLLLLNRTSDREPFIQVRSQTGGTNRYFFTPGGRTVNEYVDDPPEGLVLSTQDQLPDTGWPVSYRRVSSTHDFQAFISEITRDTENRVTSFRTTATTPDGEGLSVFTEITRNPAGEVSGYEEVRTFGKEGEDPAFTLVVSEIERLAGRGEVRYRVEYSDTEGGSGTFVYPAWQLTE